MKEADSSRRRRQRRADGQIVPQPNFGRRDGDRGRARLRGHQHRRRVGEVRAAASSIYWHFRDKRDDLIAAVIERSFGNWLQVWQLPEDVVARDRLVEVALRTAKAVSDSPDFLRLGLMLALERRPVEPRARAMFVQVRRQAFEALSAGIRDLGLDLTEAQVAQIATYAIAGADGLFLAHEIGGDSVDLVAMFELHGHALYDTALRMIERTRADDVDSSDHRAGCRTVGHRGQACRTRRATHRALSGDGRR